MKWYYFRVVLDDYGMPRQSMDTPWTQGRYCPSSGGGNVVLSTRWYHDLHPLCHLDTKFMLLGLSCLILYFNAWDDSPFFPLRQKKDLLFSFVLDDYGMPRQSTTTYSQGDIDLPPEIVMMSCQQGGVVFLKVRILFLLFVINVPSFHFGDLLCLVLYLTLETIVLLAYKADGKWC